MTQNNNKNKLTNDKENSPAAAARAERLKMVRNMANLSPAQVTENSDIKLDALYSWERGRYNGLTKKGAEKFVKRVEKEDVVCSVNWLLFEEGIPPYKRTAPVNKETLSKNKIIEEIKTFEKLHNNVVYTEIIDDGLSPNFKAGDYVAGVIMYEIDETKINNQPCIIRTSDNEILVRIITPTSAESSTFTLTCSNPQTTVKTPVLYNVQVDFIAPILRIYKKA